MRKIKTGNLQRNSRSDTIFNIVNVTTMLILLVVFVWPLWFVLIASFSNPIKVTMGEVLLLPKEFTLLSYETMVANKDIWTGYSNAIFYTVVGTAINLVLTVCCAYPLAQKDFMPRKFLTIMFMITMYFSGGMIPTYLTVKDVGLVNTRWAMIIPTAISMYNCLVMRTYFVNSIPYELKEASLLDGANAAQYLIRVVLPLSKPILAVIGLYYAVSHWGDYYHALIYLFDKELYPLQSVLREILFSANAANNVDFASGEDPAMVEQLMALAATLKYSVIIVACVPMMAIYPFIQKFFVKGVMIGSVKG